MTLPPIIPRDVLFGNPERVAPRLSPDGRRLSYLAPLDGVLNVWVGPIGSLAGEGSGGEEHGGGAAMEPVTEDRERGIRSYDWAHDGRHLLYIQDEGGDEDWHLHVVDPVRRVDVDATPFDGVQARILAADKRFPHELLLGLNRDDPKLHDAYHLDLRTLELTQRVENPGVVGWIRDADLRLRGGVRPRSDGGEEVLLGEPDDPGTWEVALAFDHEDTLSSGVVGLSRDGRSLLVVSSREANAGRLERHDLATGAVEVVAEDPTYDVSGVMRHPDTWEIQAVSFLRERVEHVVLDAGVRDDFERLASLDEGDLAVADRDHADRSWLVAFAKDDGPVSYWRWDRERRSAQHLFVHRPALAERTLARMEPFSFRARDGLTIHGYLSFPPGLERSGLPAVVDVHGGPWTRDVWGFDPEAQWLANRGYLCVQVNYRGSTGYGKDFVNAGDREWGGRMLDDLVDAVDRVVEEGYADPERIAIYGGSYGGYAALAGATFTPDRFRCVVDLVGPSNLRTLIESVPPYWEPVIAQFHRRVGHPVDDAELLWSRSPLSRVDRIRTPILVAQGANDPRVKLAESEQIVAAMREKGIDHEYLLFPDEGHGFAKPENRMRFYAAAEAFLARHLGGRAEP